MTDIPYECLRKFVIRNTGVREFFAEFWGTCVLILFGDAAFAQTILEGKGIADVFAITWAWGVGVMIGIIAASGVSGSHLNPAVTVAFATLGKISWKKVPHYLVAQHLGAFFASFVLFVVYKDGLNHFDPNRTITGPTATGKIWATYPTEFVTIESCFFDQIVGTGLLMFTVMATIDQRNMDIPLSLHPIYLGFMISALAMCFGMNCMAPLNPARDFSTRLFTAIAGWGPVTFSYREYWWVGLVGPHIGAIFGGWTYFLFISLHWPESRDEEWIHEKQEPTLRKSIYSHVI